MFMLPVNLHDENVAEQFLDLVKAEYAITGSSTIALTMTISDQLTIIPFQGALIEQVVAEYNSPLVFGINVYPAEDYNLEEFRQIQYEPEQQQEEPQSEEPQQKGDWQDEEYFDSYANLTIHQEMLQDTLRTTTYKRAIESIADLKDKIVMDIGCGSGILSIFCALAGAKHVYAIDASEIIHQAKKTVRDNGLDDKITLIQGKIEEIVLPVNKVDIIVSEWMGTMLICESMIASVLNARKLYLAPDTGLMLPATSDIYLAPVFLQEFMESKIDSWDNVYGVVMSSLKAQAHKEFFSNPLFDRCLKEDELLSTPLNVFHIDMHSDEEQILEVISCPFSFFMKKTGILHGFGTWFDSAFLPSRSADQKDEIILSTSPYNQSTHWRNVTFVLEEQLKVEAGDVIVGTITISRHRQWLRHFEVVLVYSLPGKDIPDITQYFPLWR